MSKAQPLPQNSRETAIELMRSALAHLDAAGEHIAALHLQHAISIAEGEGKATTE